MKVEIEILGSVTDGKIWIVFDSGKQIEVATENWVEILTKTKEMWEHEDVVLADYENGIISNLR